MNGMDFAWIFDGIGSQIISILISLVLGSIIGYQYCKHKNVVKQKQKARDNASQSQIGVRIDDK